MTGSSSSSVAVTADGLGKRFDIYPSDRARLLEFFGNRSHHKEFWALRDVSFAVPRGTAFGVVGANGAGKSTLLRLLSGVSQPTEGTLDVDARLSGLLDLGLGFHPDFTGRQNIALNCSVLGMGDEQVQALTPPIMEFAELEEFIEYPVRTYSAGMQLRLAFAIAAHMDYDVIFIDEVLAVGDQYFQRKCVLKIEEFLAEGRTLVMVSHDLHSIRSLCSNVLWLHGGRVVHQGPTNEVVNAYVDVARDKEGRIKARLFGGANSAQSRAMASRVATEASGDQPPVPSPVLTPDSEIPYYATSEDQSLREAVIRAVNQPQRLQEEWDRSESTQDYEETHGERPIITGTGEIRILEVRTLNAAGEETDAYATGESVTIATTFKTLSPVEDPILGVALFRNDEVYIYGPNTRFDRIEAMRGTYDGVYTYFIHYPTMPLLTGTYRISVAAFDKHHLKPHVWHNQLYEFKVTCPREDHGVIELAHEWGLVRHISGPGEALP
ncbi:MAG: ABC transporter ATP-binding protein [Deltaproteobacteria bacterium]|nr:ABC transporter ATP-binding protein [Deltaproteobacteria bacterium]